MENNKKAENDEFRFECTACGQCCYGDDDAYIEVTQPESDEIRQYLNISAAEFNNRFLVRFTDGSMGIRILENGRCSLLDEDMRCRVYAVRPVQCRTYPFWPELVRNSRRWQQEARRCEGIGHGPLVPERYIDEQVTLCKLQQARLKKEQN